MTVDYEHSAHHRTSNVQGYMSNPGRGKSKVGVNKTLECKAESKGNRFY